MYELTVYWDQGRDSLLNIKTFTLASCDQLRVDVVGLSLRVRVYTLLSDGATVLKAEFCGPRVQYTLASKI